jgi:hypothetical protein
MDYDYIIDLLSFKFINFINPWKFYSKKKIKKNIRKIVVKNIGEDSIDDIISLDIGDISEISNCSTNSIIIRNTSSSEFSNCSTNSIIIRNTFSSEFSISFGEKTFSDSDMSICSTNSINNRYLDNISDMSICSTNSINNRYLDSISDMSISN